MREKARLGGQRTGVVLMDMLIVEFKAAVEGESEE